MVPVLSLVVALAAPPAAAPEVSPAAVMRGRPVHTYSIVARDSASGQIGVAVQSHYFSVGSVVPWAEAGVGAVATQSLVEVSYGPRGLTLMRKGESAGDALAKLVKEDLAADVRQVAMVDADGHVAAHTGAHCIPSAGHYVGRGFACQANLMENDRIWPAMARAFERTGGDLADRMLAALDAAQEAGGDIRGMQSAALVVVRAKSSGQPWADRIFDFRVEDSPSPLTELRRLVRLGRAYNRETDGDTYTALRRPDEARRAYQEAMMLAPENTELVFWAAVSLYTSGNPTAAEPLFRRAFARDRRWAALLPRLVPAGLFPDDKTKLAEVLKLAPARSTASVSSTKGKRSSRHTIRKSSRHHTSRTPAKKKQAASRGSKKKKTRG